MDALKFIKEAKRMCQSYEECEACPANADGFDDCLINTEQNIDAETAVDIVEKWAKEHPEKTRQDVFLEQYPRADLLGNGVITICPKAIEKGYAPNAGCCATDCYGCKTKYWMQEVEK